MKSLKRFAIAVIAVTAFLGIPLQAQWIITTPTHICNDTIPQDSLWIVVNGGVLYLDPGCTLTIFGTLRVAPGGEVRFMDNSIVNINQPRGLIILDPANPLLPAPIIRIYQNAVVYVYPTRYIDMGSKSIIEFMGAGVIKILGTGYILMNNAVIAQSPISTGQGMVDTYESNPFRGTGNITQMYLHFNNGFWINATDTIYFIDGGKAAFSCFGIAAPTFNIYGRAEWLTTGATLQYTFADCLSGINVYNGGTFSSGNTIFDSVPNFTGNAGSVVQVGAGAFHMRFLAGIYSKGEFRAKGMTFDATNGRTWVGIDIKGNVSLLGLYDCLVTDLTQTANGVHVYDSPNVNNEIYRTTVQCLYGPLVSSGIGIYLEGSLFGVGIAKLKIICSDVNGFKVGVYNYLGDLTMDGVDAYLNNAGLYVVQGTAMVTRCLIRNNIGDGIVADNIAPRRPGLLVRRSAIIGNQGYQFNLINTNNVQADTSNIYYRTGNSTAVIVYATNSTASMPENWWGRFPTLPAQFQLILSTVTHTPERPSAWPIDRGCIYPKMSAINLEEPIEQPASIVVKSYPNPFNSSTTIEYSLDSDAMVTVNVYNSLGALVTTLVKEQQNAGTHRTQFVNTKDLPSGVYVVEVATMNGVGRQTIMLAR